MAKPKLARPFRAAWAELFGTLFLVWGATHVVEQLGPVILIEAQSFFYIGMGAAVGYFIGAIVFARISGAHFNPAVSLGAWIVGKIKWDRFLYYFFFQLFGALIASLIVWAAFPAQTLFLGTW